MARLDAPFHPIGFVPVDLPPPPEPEPYVNGHGPVPELGDFAPIDFASLAGQQPPARRYIIDEWLPTGCVTSLYGEGGIGKSLMAQQMATCAAVGLSAFGFKVPKAVNVVGLFTEDEHDELWRRQCRINDVVALQMRHLFHLQIQGRAGMENTLVTYSGGKSKLHTLMDTIAKACGVYAPGLLILDNIAQLFGGDENNRYEVSHFCNILAGIAREFDCAVLLLGHPAKSNGSEYSGSTAWNAAVRSRLFMNKNDEGELKLSMAKSNYSETGEMPLVWTRGVLLPMFPPADNSASPVVQEANERAEDVFLAALDALTARKSWMSHKVTARNYAPKVIKSNGLNQGLPEKLLERAMGSLIERGELLTEHPVDRRADRKWSFALARAGQTSPLEGEGEVPDGEAGDASDV